VTSGADPWIAFSTDLGPSQDCLGSYCWTDLGLSRELLPLGFWSYRNLHLPSIWSWLCLQLFFRENMAERISAIFLLRILCSSTIQLLGSSESVRLGSSSWLTSSARLLGLTLSFLLFPDTPPAPLPMSRSDFTLFFDTVFCVFSYGSILHGETSNDNDLQTSRSTIV
jgi:hypothetical protein